MENALPDRPGKHVMLCIGTHNLWGGIEYWLTGLARHLDANGWRVTLGLARGLRFNDPQAFVRSHPGIDAVEFDGRTGTPEGRIRAVTHVLHRQRPDLVVPVGLGDVLLAVARLKQSGRDFRLIAPLRATSPELLAEMEAFAPVIDMCIGNNPLHARFLGKRETLPPECLATVVNGVAPPPPGYLRPAASVAELRLLFVGRLHLQHKRILDLPVLLDEIERIGIPYRLTVVGDGEDRGPLLQRLGARLQEGRVRFVGHMPTERIARDIFPVHDVLVHFSASEGCPQVLQQAMAHGVVPLSSAFLGAHSLGFLRDGQTCCLFPIGDMGLAAAVLKRMHADRASLYRMAASAQAAMREYPAAQALGEWEHAFVSVLQRPARGVGQQDAKWCARTPAAGRLERAGIPPAAAEWLRWAMRRFPQFADGWAEWPGTVTFLDPPERSAMLADLQRLDAAALPLGNRASASP